LKGTIVRGQIKSEEGTPSVAVHVYYINLGLFQVGGNVEHMSWDPVLGVLGYSSGELAVAEWCRNFS
jgi:hypothetical protein